MIVYIWASPGYSTGAAIIHTVLLTVAGMLDKVLKPLLGRGVEAPIPAGLDQGAVAAGEVAPLRT